MHYRYMRTDVNKMMLRIIPVLILLLSTAACSVYSVRQQDPAEAYLGRIHAGLTGKRASEYTLQQLRLLNLDKLYRENRSAAIKLLWDRVDSSDQRNYVVALVELLLIEGLRYQREQPKLAMSYYAALTAAGREYFQRYQKGRYESLVDPYPRLIVNMYNLATAQLVTQWQRCKRPWSEEQNLEILGRSFRIRVKHDKAHHIDPAYFDEFKSAYALKVKGLVNNYGVPGIGAALIGLRSNKEGEEGFAKYRPQPEFHTPVTALLTMLPDGHSGSKYDMVMHFFDPLKSENFIAKSSEGKDKPIPLEYDFSTTFGLFLAEDKYSKDPFTGFIRALYSDQYDEDLGLVMFEPYDPGKIPVIMVHGLFSYPTTFVQMFNDLRGDERIRQRYQFLFFSYPTGLPMAYSSMRFRKQLLEFREEFDPDHTNPQFDRTVMVGHSMGGLLTKAMLTDSGMQVWDAFLTVAPEEMKVNKEEERQSVKDLLIFEPVSYISRAIFIATPHRGSPIADNFIGRLGSRLISLPQAFTRGVFDLVTLNLDNLSFEQKGPIFKPATSIDQLSKEHPFLKALADLPVREGVPYHSIIGIRDAEEVEGSSDGIVVYPSSSIEGADSEYYVHAGHSSLKHPDTIAEVKRILLLHLDETQTEPKPSDAETAAAVP